MFSAPFLGLSFYINTGQPKYQPVLTLTKTVFQKTFALDYLGLILGPRGFNHSPCPIYTTPQY